MNNEETTVLELLKTIQASMEHRFSHIERTMSDLESRFTEHNKQVNTLLVTGDVDKGKVGIAHEQHQMRATLESLQKRLDTLLDRSRSQDQVLERVQDKISDLTKDVDRLRTELQDAARTDQNRTAWISKTVIETLVRWLIPFVLMLVGYGIWYMLNREGV